MRRSVALLLSLLCAASAGVTTAPPAAAHSADPRVVTVVDAVEPALPDGVVVQVRAGIAAQVVASNRTTTPLDVLGRSGEPFLRISSAGVQANLESPDFYETSNPVGSVAAAPARVRDATAPAAPRFVRIGGLDSWGWYDHRLHPRQVGPPVDDRVVARLGEFTVPLRYGTTAVTVRGHVEFRPLRGTFDVTADLAPAELPGVQVQVLQSNKLPGLFLTNTQNRTFTVLGSDGEPFARFGPRGLEVNEASRTRVEDQQARGAQTAMPSTTPRFELLGGTGLTWLDSRLRWASEAPPDAALRSDEPTVLGRWEVPVQLEGRRTALTGEIRWVPSGASLVERPGRRVWPLALGGLGVAAALAGTVLGVRRAARRTQV